MTVSKSLKAAAADGSSALLSVGETRGASLVKYASKFPVSVADLTCKVEVLEKKGQTRKPLERRRRDTDGISELSGTFTDRYRATTKDSVTTQSSAS